MRHLAQFVVVAMALCACGVEEFEAQLKAASTELEQKVGSRPFPAWKSNNGVLTEVNFIFETDDVAKYSIGDLEKFVREATAKHVVPPPRNVSVSVQRGIKQIVRPNNTSERTEKHGGPRLAAARSSWPAAQLGR